MRLASAGQAMPAPATDDVALAADDVAYVQVVDVAADLDDLAGLDLAGAPAPPRSAGAVLGGAQGPDFCSTAGSKDLRLVSSGQPWPLIHLPLGPAAWRPSWGAWLQRCATQLEIEKSMVYRANLDDGAFAAVVGHAPYFDEPFYAGFAVGGFELGLMPDAPDAGAGIGRTDERFRRHPPAIQAPAPPARRRPRRGSASTDWWMPAPSWNSSAPPSAR